MEESGGDRLVSGQPVLLVESADESNSGVPLASHPNQTVSTVPVSKPLGSHVCISRQSDQLSELRTLFCAYMSTRICSKIACY